MAQLRREQVSDSDGAVVDRAVDEPELAGGNAPHLPSLAASRHIGVKVGLDTVEPRRGCAIHDAGGTLAIQERVADSWRGEHQFWHGPSVTCVRGMRE